MTCRSIMLTEPVVVQADATVASGVDLLFQHRIRTLPVVDRQNVYQGLFGIQFLLKELLPKAATLDQEQGLSRLAFMHDTLDDVRSSLRTRLESLYPQPAGTIAYRATAPLSADDGLLEVMLRLYHAGHSLPVVDPQTHELLGVVSHWSILAKLTERAR